jgi:hypothetical protein
MCSPACNRTLAELYAHTHIQVRRVINNRESETDHPPDATVNALAHNLSRACDKCRAHGRTPNAHVSLVVLLWTCVHTRNQKVHSLATELVARENTHAYEYTGDYMRFYGYEQE